MTDAQCIDILGTYVSEVACGSNLQRKKDLSAQSLRNYMRAAHRVLQVWLHRDIPIYDSSSMGKKPRFHEYIGQQLRDRRNWERKKDKKLPLTRAIYTALAAYLASKGDSLDVFLAAVYAVYDWLRLGVFTGFRVSEFAQNKVRKGCQFLAIPDNDDVPEDQRGKPVAFIAADFTFWTLDMVLIPHSKLRKWHAKGLVHGLQIRWRFDKSANNFVIRTYTVTNDAIFNPVDAAVSIILRSQLLGVPIDEPIVVWRNVHGRPYRFLRDSTLTQTLRDAVCLAYPDPNHYYRLQIKSIVPHVIRVESAYRMQLGGANNDEIAHSKRWHVTSVPTYLRDGFLTAHAGQAKTLKGLYHDGQI